eukprot:19086_4
MNVVEMLFFLALRWTSSGCRLLGRCSFSSRIQTRGAHTLVFWNLSPTKGKCCSHHGFCRIWALPKATFLYPSEISLRGHLSSSLKRQTFSKSPTRESSSSVAFDHTAQSPKETAYYHMGLRDSIGLSKPNPATQSASYKPILRWILKPLWTTRSLFPLPRRHLSQSQFQKEPPLVNRHQRAHPTHPMCPNHRHLQELGIAWMVARRLHRCRPPHTRPAARPVAPSCQRLDHRPAQAADNSPQAHQGLSLDTASLRPHPTPTDSHPAAPLQAKACRTQQHNKIS